MYFANLCGIKKNAIRTNVNSLIKKLGLIEYKNTLAMNLSGGNKRKLCLAMALIGKPKIMYIDEASTGIDPAARQKICQAIISEGAESAIIFSTNTIEDVEELATKLAIIDDGKFKCFGSPHEIKEKFGQGFEVEISLDTAEILQGLPLAPDEESKNLRTMWKYLEVW